MSLFELIPAAHAQAAGQPAGAGGISDLLQGPLPMFMIIGLIFYFLIFRPQQQRAKQLKNQLDQLKRGDSIVTSGGIIGTVARVVNNEEILVDIAEGVRVRVVRATITGLASKGEPRGDPGKAEPDAAELAAPAARPARRGKAANDGKPQS